jgi:hypothetical protein
MISKKIIKMKLMIYLLNFKLEFNFNINLLLD